MDKIICVPSVKEALYKGWQSSDFDFSEYEEMEHQSYCIFAELSRQLRAGLIDCFWHELDSQLKIWTRSMKKKDAVQKTNFLIAKSDYLPCNDIQIESYDELSHNLDFGIIIHTM